MLMLNTWLDEEEIKSDKKRKKKLFAWFFEKDHQEFVKENIKISLLIILIWLKSSLSFCYSIINNNQIIKHFPKSIKKNYVKFQNLWKPPERSNPIITTRRIHENQ